MSRVKSSTAQLAHLSEHMKTHPDMASGVANTLQGRADLERQWVDLSNILNSLGGPMKTVAKWKQAWRDLRNNVKKKAAHNHRELRGYELGTGNGPPCLKQLSEVEKQVLSVTGSTAVFGIDGVNETEEQESASSESVSHSESLILQVKPGLSGCHSVMIVEEGLSQWDETAAAFVGEGTVREVLDSLPAASLTTAPGNEDIGACIKDETVSSSEDDRVLGEITENESPPAVGSRDRGGAQRRMSVTTPSRRRRPSLPSQRAKRTSGGPAQRSRNLHASPRPSKARGGVPEAARRRLLRRSPPPQRRSETASITERLIAIEERRVDAEHAIARSQEMFAQGHLKMAEALNKLTNTLGIFAQQLFESHRQRRSSFNGG